MNNLLFSRRFFDSNYNNFLSGLELAWQNFDEVAPDTQNKNTQKRKRK